MRCLRSSWHHGAQHMETAFHLQHSIPGWPAPLLSELGVKSLLEATLLYQVAVWKQEYASW